MTKENENKPEVKNFEVEQIHRDHPMHKRHEFSFTVDGNEFKGHFDEGEITWMHPYPKQIIGEKAEAKIENKIRELLGEHGIASMIDDIEMKPVFEDTAHERHQFILNVQGHEYKGYVQDEEIHWFHPHPKQKLTQEHVEAIETEIHEKKNDPS